MLKDTSISQIYLSGSEIILVPFHRLFNNKPLRRTYLSWLNDIDNLKLIASDALMVPNKDDAFIDSSFERFTSDKASGFFVYYKKSNSFIGTCKLEVSDNSPNSATDGILIGDKRCQGRGLATPIYQTLLSFGFCYLSLDLIDGGCNSNNLAMLRIFKKFGYQHTRTISNADCIDNLYSNHDYFSLSRNKFLEQFNCEQLQISRTNLNLQY